MRNSLCLIKRAEEELGSPDTSMHIEGMLDPASCNDGDIGSYEQIFGVIQWVRFVSARGMFI